MTRKELAKPLELEPPVFVWDPPPLGALGRCSLGPATANHVHRHWTPWIASGPTYSSCVGKHTSVPVVVMDPIHGSPQPRLTGLLTRLFVDDWKGRVPP